MVDFPRLLRGWGQGAVRKFLIQSNEIAGVCQPVLQEDSVIAVVRINYFEEC